MSVFINNVANEIYILLLQEIELEKDFDCELLNISGYIFEYENHDHKKRVGMYIRNNIKYVRCPVFEGQNSHLMVIDTMNKKGT